MSNKEAYFPLFINLADKKIVFIGGGNIAARRIKVLLDFSKHITVVAPEVSDELKEIICRKDIEYICDRFSKEHLKDADIVLACTDDKLLNQQIYLHCKENKIMVNNCSNKEQCDFYFPGIVKKENIVIGVNAGGKAHSMARAIREKIEKLLADGE